VDGLAGGTVAEVSDDARLTVVMEEEDNEAERVERRLSA